MSVMRACLGELPLWQLPATSSLGLVHSPQLSLQASRRIDCIVCADVCRYSVILGSGLLLTWFHEST